MSVSVFSSLEAFDLRYETWYYKELRDKSVFIDWGGGVVMEDFGGDHMVFKGNRWEIIRRQATAK